MESERRPTPSEAGLTVLRWMMLGEWRAHPSRVLLAAAAIAIGVALGFAVHLVNRSALEEFAKAIDTVSGAADLQVRSVTATGFDEGLYPVLARLPGVAAATILGDGRVALILDIDTIVAVSRGAEFIRSDKHKAAG